MNEKKDPAKKEPAKQEPHLHRHGSPVIHADGEEDTGGAVVEVDDPTVFHPGRHRVGISEGAGPDVPNLSPGGSVTIKR